MQYDDAYQAYMDEVKHYLSQVDRGRRVADNEPSAHRFSQPVDDQRQARVMGIPYQAPPQATAPTNPALSPQYGFRPLQRDPFIQDMYRRLGYR